MIFFCTLQKKKTHLAKLLAGSGSTIEIKKAILTGSITDKRFYIELKFGFYRFF